MSLALIFSVILSLTFLCIYLSTRPTRTEQQIARRLIGLRVADAPAPESEGVEAAQLLKEQKTGALGRIEDALMMLPFSRKVERTIVQSGSAISLSSLCLRTAGCASGSFLLAQLFLKLFFVDLAVSLLAATVPYMVLAFKRSRRVHKFNVALPDAIDMIARGIRAGHSVSSALEMMAQNSPEPLASEFMEVFKQQNVGLPLRDALHALSERMPSKDLRVLITAILVQKDTGGNLSEVLDRTVFVIRERLRIQGEIKIQTAQGRMTGWILSSLPIVMLVLINLVNPGYSKVLLDDPTGRLLLYVGVGLIGIGAFFIRRITNGIEV